MVSIITHGQAFQSGSTAETVAMVGCGILATVALFVAGDEPGGCLLVGGFFGGAFVGGFIVAMMESSILMIILAIVLSTLALFSFRKMKKNLDEVEGAAIDIENERQAETDDIAEWAREYDTKVESIRNQIEANKERISALTDSVEKWKSYQNYTEDIEKHMYYLECNKAGIECPVDESFESYRDDLLKNHRLVEQPGS